MFKFVMRFVFYILCYFSVVCAAEGESARVMVIRSADFAPQGEIPKRFSCDGADIPPALTWSGIPKNSKSLVLIVDDPDAPDPAHPKMTWVHWLLYNIPPTATGLAEGIKTTELPAGTRQGTNDWRRTGYGGPCPPIGRHRYFHKLYALDTLLQDLQHPNKKQLEKAMQGHIIGYAELIGTYRHQ